MRFFKKKEKIPVLPFDAVSELPPEGRKLPLAFMAKTLDYFKLWVVCQCLTICTLGLYSPWARRRRLIFLSNHWQLDGAAFDVQLAPLPLLFGRLFALCAVVLYVAAAWLYPWLAPLCIFLAFAPLPWLLSNSFAFRWRTMTYRGISFNASVEPRHLWFPVWMLAATLVLAALPAYFWKDLLGDSVIALAFFSIIIALIILPPLFFWPRLTAWLVHHKLSRARFGQTPFELAATESEIYKHMNKAFIKSWVFWWMMVVIAVMTTFTIAKPDINRDVQGVITAFCMLTVTVAGVTMARGRRLNFVLHRLTIGNGENGLRFTTTLNPNQAAKLTTAYAVLAVVTLGLSIPWATVHYNRWRAKHVQFYLQGDWTQFVNESTIQKRGGILDELANSFDIELGI